MDSELQELKRADPTGWKTRFAEYRITGTFIWQVGDHLIVKEVDSPWMTGNWKAVITKLEENGDGRVDATGPFEPNVYFPAHKTSFYLSKKDLACSIPVMP